MARMNLEDAKVECDRWFAYLKAQKDMTAALQQLAADRRSGRCDAAEGERRREDIQGCGVTVYDGSNLADAVRVLLAHV